MKAECAFAGHTALKHDHAKLLRFVFLESWNPMCSRRHSGYEAASVHVVRKLCLLPRTAVRFSQRYFGFSPHTRPIHFIIFRRVLGCLQHLLAAVPGDDGVLVGRARGITGESMAPPSLHRYEPVGHLLDGCRDNRRAV